MKELSVFELGRKFLRMTTRTCEPCDLVRPGCYVVMWHHNLHEWGHVVHLSTGYIDWNYAVDSFVTNWQGFFSFYWKMVSLLVRYWVILVFLLELWSELLWASRFHCSCQDLNDARFSKPQSLKHWVTRSCLKTESEVILVCASLCVNKFYWSNKAFLLACVSVIDSGCRQVSVHLPFYSLPP